LPPVKRCNRCLAPLGKQYIRAENLLFHPQCFICNHCQERLGEEFRLKDNKVYHAKCSQTRFKLTCAHCQQALGERWMTLDGKKLHEACYQAHYQQNCEVCGGELTGSYTRDPEGLGYHTACYAQHKAPRCDGCAQPIVGQFLQDLWGNRLHPHHGGQATLQCHVCARLISEKTSQGGVQYGDGRIVCGICQISEITTPAQIEHARQWVLQTLKGVGFDYIPNYIAVSLADQRTLQKRLGVGRNANSHGFTKTLIKDQPGQGRIQEHSIFILYGLPRLLFMGVLAHELLHVWLNERQLNDVWGEKEIEGFCNLATALIYQKDGTPLAQVLLERLEKDKNPIYGEGYRKMASKLQKTGWSVLIQEMQTKPQTALGKLMRFTDRFV
jgi:hypothetical protein